MLFGMSEISISPISARTLRTCDPNFLHANDPGLCPSELEPFHLIARQQHHLLLHLGSSCLPRPWLTVLTE